jgi:hypothetical protein
MEAIALAVTGIISATVLLSIAALWQFPVAFLMSFGLPQGVAVFGPIPTVMLIALAVDFYRTSRG